jgi:DNA polymerase III delta prime subunit
MYTFSKGLELVLAKCNIKDEKVSVKELTTNLHAYITSSEEPDTKIQNILKFIQKNHGRKFINIIKIIDRANRIAHKEWLSKIMFFHFILAFAFELGIETTILDDYVNEEIMYLPIENKFGVNGHIVNTALNRPLHVIENKVNSIANALSIHNAITITGPKGIGKKSTILSLIKCITLKKYPLLYNSNILVNPDKKVINQYMQDYNGAYTICIINQAENSNVLPNSSWEGINLSERLKFIYIVDDNDKFFQQALAPMAAFITKEIKISEITPKDVKKIINVHIKSLKPYVNVDIDDKSIEYIIQASNRFDSSEHQPTKSINMLMEIIFNELNYKTKLINSIPIDIDSVTSEQRNDIIKSISPESTTKITRMASEKVDIDINTIEKFIVEKFALTDEVLASMMSTNIREHLKGLKTKILNKVYGQNSTIEQITKALWRRGLKLDPMNRPVSFMFIGATGTGKTHTAKTLSEYLLGDEKKMVRFDMSEYMDKHEVSKLIGSPPGYVGSNQPGRLTDEVSKNPYAVLLFDEIEKAHRDIMNIFLQILDDGRLTDNHGKTIDFSKTIIIMTSNIGTDKAYSAKRSIGFSTNTSAKDNKKQIMLAEVEKEFKPEFINRIDRLIVFNELNTEEFKKIIKSRLIEIKESSILDIIYEDINKVSDSILEKAKDKQYNIDKYNAREVKRVIVDTIENAIIDYLDDNAAKVITIKNNLKIEGK